MDEFRPFLQAILEVEARNAEEIHQLKQVQQEIRKDIAEVKRNQEHMLRFQGRWEIKEPAPPIYRVFS